MRRALTLIGLLIVLIQIGSLGLMWIEGAPWFESFYLCVITLTTVGFQETIELSTPGRGFLIVYLLVGIGLFGYLVSVIGQSLVENSLGSILKKRRMKQRIESLTGHYIVCGAGRMGSTICAYLHDRKRPFVLLDCDEERLSTMCEENDWPGILGDATDDEILREAGIERARSLATVLPTDAANVYVTLSAHILNPELQIIARASEEKAIGKLEAAGATRVVSPFSSGAIRMARFMITPSVEDFLEVTGQAGNLELADVHIGEGSPYLGMKLQDTNLRSEGVMVIGIRRANGEQLFPPPGSAILEVGDSLFAFGSTDGVNALLGNLQTSAP